MRPVFPTLRKSSQSPSVPRSPSKNSPSRYTRPKIQGEWTPKPCLKSLPCKKPRNRRSTRLRSNPQAKRPSQSTKANLLSKISPRLLTKSRPLSRRASRTNPRPFKSTKSIPVKSLLKPWAHLSVPASRLRDQLDASTNRHPSLSSKCMNCHRNPRKSRLRRGHPSKSAGQAQPRTAAPCSRFSSTRRARRATWFPLVEL